MNNHKYLCALAVTMMVGAKCCVPVCAQQRMSLQSLFDLADQQSQRIKVSEVALKAAEEGVASAKTALLPSVEFSVQGATLACICNRISGRKTIISGILNVGCPLYIICTRAYVWKSYTSEHLNI